MVRLILVVDWHLVLIELVAMTCHGGYGGRCLRICRIEQPLRLMVDNCIVQIVRDNSVLVLLEVLLVNLEVVSIVHFWIYFFDLV